MAAKIKLKEYIRFRKESNYILLCNLKNLEDYEMPLKYYHFLLRLKGGSKKNDSDADLIKDLKNIKAI